MHRFHGGFTEIFHLHCWGFWLSFYFTKRKREKRPLFPIYVADHRAELWLLYSGGIALGSLYNYFVSKAELLSATVEAVWADIFPVGEISEDCKNIVDYLKILLESAEKSKERYPQFFSMHALSFAAGEKQEGRKTMEEYFEKIKHQMLRFIRNDEKIRSHIFTERLSKEVSGGCFVWMELFKCT